VVFSVLGRVGQLDLIIINLIILSLLRFSSKTRSYRRITIRNGNRRENVRKKVKTNDAGLDDGGMI